jgi:hypothetical protein
MLGEGPFLPVKTVIAKNVPRVCSQGSNAFGPRGEDKFSGWMVAEIEREE